MPQAIASGPFLQSHPASVRCAGCGGFRNVAIIVPRDEPRGADVQISVRAVVIAHTRGPGRVIIQKAAFVGPHVVVACSSGRTLTIGEGAVVSAGCVVTKDVPPHIVLMPAPGHVSARATVPLTTAETMDEFYSGLRSVHSRDNPENK